MLRLTRYRHPTTVIPGLDPGTQPDSPFRPWQLSLGGRVKPGHERRLEAPLTPMSSRRRPGPIPDALHVLGGCGSSRGWTPAFAGVTPRMWNARAQEIAILAPQHPPHTQPIPPAWTGAAANGARVGPLGAGVKRTGLAPRDGIVPAALRSQGRRSRESMPKIPASRDVGRLILVPPEAPRVSGPRPPINRRTASGRRPQCAYSSGSVVNSSG
jgi:hypothetical protein